MDKSSIEEVAAIRPLGGVLRWAFAQSPPAELIGVVGQDEFTNDVIVRVAPAIFLVFDAT